jgi:pyruvate dehydrogenase E1 component beta subunit
MFGGQGRVGMVARLPNGLWAGSAAQHSQSLEAWFAHIPGLVVVAPATPQDNHALLAASLACGDPVVYLEHKELWGLEDDVAPARTATLGEAEIARPGSDVTVVTWSKTRHAALEAAALAEKDGVSLEIIDLRTIWPWDRETVLASAERTGRVLIAHEAVQVAGFGAEIAATLAEESGARVRRLGAPRIPVGYSLPLEDESRITPRAIAAACLELRRARHSRRG